MSINSTSSKSTIPFGIVAHTHPAFNGSNVSAKPSTTSEQQPEIVSPTSDHDNNNNSTKNLSNSKNVNLNPSSFDLVSLRSPKPPTAPPLTSSNNSKHNITSPKSARVITATAIGSMSDDNSSNQKTGASGTPLTSRENQVNANALGKRETNPVQEKDEESGTQTNNNNNNNTNVNTSHALVPTPNSSSLPVAVLQDLAQMKQQLILQHNNNNQKKTKSVLGNTSSTSLGSALANLNKEISDFITNSNNNSNNRNVINNVESTVSFRQLMSDSRLPTVGGKNGSTNVQLPSSNPYALERSQNQPQSSAVIEKNININAVSATFLPPISLAKSSLLRQQQQHEGSIFDSNLSIANNRNTIITESHRAGNELTLLNVASPNSPLSRLNNKPLPKHWTDMLPMFSELESGPVVSSSAQNQNSSNSVGSNGDGGSFSSSGHAVPPLATELLSFIRRELKMVYAPIFDEYYKEQQNQQQQKPSQQSQGKHSQPLHNAAHQHLQQQLHSFDVRVARWRVFLDAYRCLCGHFKEYGSLLFLMLREFEDLFEAMRFHLSDRALFSLVANNAEEVALSLAKETTQNVFDELALTKKRNKAMSVQILQLQQEVNLVKVKHTTLQEEKIKSDNEVVVSHERNKILVDALQGEATRQNIAYAETKVVKDENLRLHTAVRTLQERAKKDSFLQEELFSKLDQVALALRDAGFDVSSVLQGGGNISGGKAGKSAIRGPKNMASNNNKKSSPSTTFKKSAGGDGGFGDFVDANDEDEDFSHIHNNNNNDGDDNGDDDDDNNSDDDDDEDDASPSPNVSRAMASSRLVVSNGENPHTLEGMRRIGSTLLHKIANNQKSGKKKKKNAPNKNSSSSRVPNLEHGDDWLTSARMKADRRLSTVLESLAGTSVLGRNVDGEDDDDEDDDHDENGQIKSGTLFKAAMKGNGAVTNGAKVQKIVTEARRDKDAADREKMIRESMKFAASCAGDSAAEKLQEALLRCFAKVRKYRTSIGVLRSTIERLESKMKKMGSALSQSQHQSQQLWVSVSQQQQHQFANANNNNNASNGMTSFLSNSFVGAPRNVGVPPLASADPAWGQLQKINSNGSFTSDYNNNNNNKIPGGDNDQLSLAGSHADLRPLMMIGGNNNSNINAATNASDAGDFARFDSARPLTPRPNWQKLIPIVPNLTCGIDDETGLLPSSDEILDNLVDLLKQQQSEKLREIERKILSNRVSGWLDEERGNSRTRQVTNNSSNANDISSMLVASSRSFVGLGSGQEIPIYLRYTGRLRNRMLGKGDVELLLKRFWKARQDSVLPTIMPNGNNQNESNTNFSMSNNGRFRNNEFLTSVANDANDGGGGGGGFRKRSADLTADLAQGGTMDITNYNNQNGPSGGFREGDYATPIDEFYQQWLQQSTGNPKAAIELAYSINDVCEKFQHDPDCGMFLKIMRGVISEHCLAHEMYTVDQLKRVFMDLDSSHTGILPRSMVYRVLKQLFPSKRYGDALRLRFALIPFTTEDEEGHASVRYIDLFEEDSEGNQTAFIERLRHQHFDEALEVLVDIESAVRETQQTTGSLNKQIPIWQIAHSIRNVDGRMPTGSIVHVLCVGCQMAPNVVQEALDRHDSTVQVDVEEFFRRVRRGVYVRRFSPPPEDDLALLEDEADDADIEDNNDEGQGTEADEKRLKQLIREEVHDAKVEKEEAEKQKALAEEKEAQARSSFKVASDQDKASVLLEASVRRENVNRKENNFNNNNSGNGITSSSNASGVGGPNASNSNNVNNNNNRRSVVSFATLDDKGQPSSSDTPRATTANTSNDDNFAQDHEMLSM